MVGPTGAAFEADDAVDPVLPGGAVSVGGEAVTVTVGSGSVVPLGDDVAGTDE